MSDLPSHLDPEGWNPPTEETKAIAEDAVLVSSIRIPDGPDHEVTLDATGIHLTPNDGMRMLVSAEMLWALVDKWEAEIGGMYAHARGLAPNMLQELRALLPERKVQAPIVAGEVVDRPYSD